MTEYTLPTTGGTAQFDILDAPVLSDILALQEAARAALPAEARALFQPLGTAFFQNLLTRQTGLMIGIRKDNKLIAQMGLVGPMELREAVALHIITDNDIVFSHAALTDSVIIFKGLSTHPSWRSDDLEKSLVSYALGLPFCQVIGHVFAQAPVGDKSHWNAFATQGFGIVAAAYDAKDSRSRFIFQKPAFGFDFSPAIIADDVDPVLDFPAIINLTQREALVGIYEEGSTTRLAFFRNREVLNIMPTLAKVESHK